MVVLVTGASGFLGRALTVHLLASGHSTIATSRHAINLDTEWRPTPESQSEQDWVSVVDGVDVVIHLAGIAHRPATDAEYHRVNVASTLALAAAAMQTNVRQFIFVSSIAAQTGPSSDKVLTERDEPYPTTPYGRSKLEAERRLASMGLPLTILRPVVVYGKQPKGSFHFLEKLALLPVPLPFGRFEAKRSILSIDNFCSAVTTVLGRSRCLGETYIVANPTPKSLPQMIADIRSSRNIPPLLFSVPIGLLKPILKLGGVWDQVGRPLVVDPRKLEQAGWAPVDSPLRM